MLKQEIFAVGTWNGFPFSLNDLRKMAASFTALGEVLKVPLKLGHNDEQPVTDGQPALGWVSQMEVIGDKLVATFEDVPDIVMQAFEKKLYRSVSIELDFDVEHKGTPYDFVITAVALLGADMPAVNVLNDLAAFMSRNSNLPRGDYTAGRHLSFTTISGNRTEKTTMTPEEIAAMQAENAKLKADAITASAKFSALETSSKAEKEASDARFAAIEADQKKAKVDAARSNFTAILEKAVSEKAITPAQRESFSKILRLDDDEHVLTISEDDVKALFSADDDSNKFSKQNAKDNDDEHQDDPAQSLTEKTYAYMSKSGSTDFSASMEVVMKAEPELAREYINSNGEIN